MPPMDANREKQPKISPNPTTVSPYALTILTIPNKLGLEAID